LDSVQLIVACVGLVVGVVLVHPERASTGAVCTTRLMLLEAPVPVPGVAVSVPLYVCALVPVLTVIVPQLLLALQLVTVPDKVVPLAVPYVMPVALAPPVLLSGQLIVAAVGAIAGLVTVHVPNTRAGVGALTVRL
jgi:hypothetical protein